MYIERKREREIYMKIYPTALRENVSINRMIRSRKKSNSCKA